MKLLPTQEVWHHVTKPYPPTPRSRKTHIWQMPNHFLGNQGNQ